MKRALFVVITVILLALSIWGSWWWLSLFILPVWILLFGLSFLPYTTIEKIQPLIKNRLTGYIGTIFLAWILVQLLRALVIEPYAVPSESMRPTILPGDKIIVNKIGYGAPFYRSHNSKRPVKRLPQFYKPQINDIVAFHLPNADSILEDGANYYPLCRELGRDSVVATHGVALFQSIEERPVFLKRIVACPGDTINIANGVCEVNGVKETIADLLIFMCQIEREHLDLLNQNLILLKQSPLPDCTTEQTIVFPLTLAHFNILTDRLPRKALKKQLHPVNGRDPNIFPFSQRYYYNRDFMGPFIIPSKDYTLDIDTKNFAIYSRLMQHEGIDIKALESVWITNKNYRFQWSPKQDYFWVMGDNRHKSLDSRYWGFLPKDHIVGKAIRVWWSANPEISGFKRYRTSRFGKAVYPD